MGLSLRGGWALEDATWSLCVPVLRNLFTAGSRQKCRVLAEPARSMAVSSNMQVLDSAWQPLAQERCSFGLHGTSLATKCDQRCSMSGDGALSPVVAPLSRTAETEPPSFVLFVDDNRSGLCTCAACGSSALQVARRTPNGWQCPSCWLGVAGRAPMVCATEDDDDSAVLALLGFDGGFDVMRRIVTVARSAVSGGITTHGRAALRGPPRNAPMSTQRIHVLWDALDAWCALLARALYNEFALLLVFFEVHDIGAVCAAADGLPGGAVDISRLARAGGVSAVLPSGVFIPDVETNQKILLWELNYRRTLLLPTPADLQCLGSEYIEPLRALRQAANNAPRWWAASPVRDRLLSALSEQMFAIVDNFLPDDVFEALALEARSLHHSGQLRLGRAEQKGTHGEYWGPDETNEADFLNEAGVDRKWTVQGDHRRWLRDGDPLAPTLARHTAELDALVMALRGDVDLEGFAPSALVPKPTSTRDVIGRLRQADFREYGMVACYPGKGGGRYHKHSDTNRNAVLTTILYLNDDLWAEKDGGAIRMYHEGLRNCEVKYDVMPVRNRLLLFWSDESCPHEVLDMTRDRYAVTVWFTDGRHVLAHPRGLTQLLKNLHVVRPLTVGQALRRTGAEEGQAERVELLYEFYLGREYGPSLGESGQSDSAQQREEQDLVKYLADRGLCSQCSRVKPGEAHAAFGEGIFSGQWYCKHCWVSWDASFKPTEGG